MCSVVDEYVLSPLIPRRDVSTHPIVIIQARMGSTRLPGKVLLPINGSPMLQGMVERLRSCKETPPIILATTTLKKDDVLADLAHKMGVSVFRGSEDDVLDRFAQAASSTSADSIVRLTADCPLIDPAMVDTALNLFYNARVDYLSNTIRRTYPRGLDIEIFTREALIRAAEKATLKGDREHVTQYIVHHPTLFHLGGFVTEVDLSSWRLTVDTKEDFAVVEHFLESLGSAVSFESIKKLVHLHPEWRKINEGVHQKRE